MTNVIEGLAKKIDNVPAELLDDAIRAFVVIAERNGGKMMGGKYQLTAKVAKRYNRPGVAYAFVKGVPSGFWAWKETGTQAHEIRPKKKRRRRRGKRSYNVPGPMGLPGHPVFGPVTHPGTSGSLKWTKTCDQADAAIGSIVQRYVDEAVT